MRAAILTCLLLPVIFAPTGIAWARAETELAPIGKHAPLFVVEKTENPQNVLMVFTKLDTNCQLIQDATKKPTLDYYWLMDRMRYKPTHVIIKGAIQKRLQRDDGATRDSFKIKLKDLVGLNTDLKDPAVRVAASRDAQGKCQTASYLRLGPSDGNREIRIDSIYTESKPSLLPPFRRVAAVTLKGVDSLTGAAVSRQYFAR